MIVSPSLALSLATSQALAESKPVAWREHSFPSSGVRLSYPDSYEAWIEGSELFIRQNSSAPPRGREPSPDPRADRALNGRNLSHDGRYLLHLSLAMGDFALANSRHRIFGKSSQGLRVAFGRFENSTASRLELNGWKGYESTIICSTLDEETGFHAAGGSCYWGLVSDGFRYAVVDSQPLNPQTAQIVRGVMKSLRFIK